MIIKIQINEKFNMVKDENDNVWLYEEGKPEPITYVKNYMRLHKWIRDMIPEAEFNHAVSQLSSHELIKIDDEYKQRIINYFNPDLIKDQDDIELEPKHKLDPTKTYIFPAGDRKVYKQWHGNIFTTEKNQDNIKTVANFSVESMIRYKDSIGLSEEPLYTLTYYHGFDEEVKTIKKATKEELLEHLWNQDLFNVPKNEAETILRAIRHGLHGEGVMEKRETMFYRGFFIDKTGKLVFNTNIDGMMTSDVELFDAVLMLIDLLEFSNHDGKRQYKHAAILRKTLHMPFHFCLKQIGLASDNTNGLKLHGKAGASKTGTVRIGNWFYLELPSETNDSVDTLAAMSRTMGSTTFPTLLDDAYTLFAQEHVRNITKTGMYSLHLRTIAGKESNETITYYAMSTPIITYNENIGITDEGLLRRMDDITFGFDDVFLKEDIKAFTKRFMPENDDSPLKALSHIGVAFRDWIKPYLERKDIELSDIEAMTIQFFKETFERLGMEYAPLTTPYEYEEALEDHADIIRRQFNKELLRSRTIIPGDGISESHIETVARNGEFDWLSYQPNNKNYVLRVNPFIAACNKATNQSWNFKDLMTELDIGDYDVTRIKLDGKTERNVTVINFKDLVLNIFGVNEIKGLTAETATPLLLIGEER